MRSGAEALVEALERAGTEVVFGYPGANIVDVFDALPEDEMVKEIDNYVARRA